jgi:hypothetical protein
MLLCHEWQRKPPDPPPNQKKKKKLRGIIIIPLTLKNYIYERILGIILEHMAYL